MFHRADLIAQAKSGTGKTCVFSVIALENVNLTVASIQVRNMLLVILIRGLLTQNAKPLAMIEG